MKQSMFGFFQLPRRWKRAIQFAVDSVIAVSCLVIAMFLRLDNFGYVLDYRFWATASALAAVTVPALDRAGLYRSFIRFMAMTKALRLVLLGVIPGAILLFAIGHFKLAFVPRSVPFIYALLAVCGIGGFRLVVRSLYSRQQAGRKKPVVIYGAGAAGRQLISMLTRGPEYQPVALIDDNIDLHRSIIEGMRVYPASSLPSILAKNGANTVLLAMPRIGRAALNEIVTRLESLDVQVRTIPGFSDIISGRAKVSDIRTVEVEDLLGRDPVPPNKALMEANIAGKTVLVSGAGGSIGSELCRQIAVCEPHHLLLVDNSEIALYRIELQLRNKLQALAKPFELTAVLASVGEPKAMCQLLRDFDVNTIFHAAAYKHVPLVENNVVNGVRNNVFGTLALAEAAIEAGVANFIMISTDKAVRPTNVMGASKRLAELICQALATRQTTTRFSMVRFGNVLGSSGSVVPLFREQIAIGGPVTVTHPDITRYFMTIPEAAQLVIQAGAMAYGGEVFLLNMGNPIRIVDLATRMIRLSGFTPVLRQQSPASASSTAGDINIVFTGLRPGEKLYEELLIGGKHQPTDHPRIMRATESSAKWSDLQSLIKRLERAFEQSDAVEIRKLLADANLAYTPGGDGTQNLPKHKTALSSQTV